MSTINTNVSSIIAQNNLARSNADLSVSLERLSTGLRINRGSDDPAGLIVSERLRREIAGIEQAIGNGERASNVISTAEAALQEISTLLTDIKALTIEASNSGAFSQEEIEANQLQIDSAVATITRISNTTSFAGLKLLNGSLDFQTSGVASSAIQDVKIFAGNYGTNATIPVSVEVLNSAETGQLFVSALGTSALASSVTFEVQGSKGVEVFSFVSGTALSAVVFAVNQISDSVGVSAALVNGGATSGIVLGSTEYGSDAFVSVRKISGGATFQTLDALGGAGNAVNRDEGEDVLALVNGSLALGDGTNVKFRGTAMDLELNLTTAAATTLATHAFTVTGGGATYQIGPEVNSQQNVSIGIQSVAASRLGNEAQGFLSSIITGGASSLVDGNAADASTIVDTSIDQVAVLRGRLGAFERNTLQTTIRSQQIALENLTASESSIRDTDFAAETARLTRAQILVQAGTATLQIANSTAQNVLALLS